MVEERASPSAGWREIYDEMGADSDQREASDERTRERCPECGLVVARDEEHRCPLANIEGVDEGDKNVEVRVEKVDGNVEILLTPGESDD